MGLEEIAEKVLDIARIKYTTGTSKPLIIAIDGRSCAGKTSLASCLKDETGCSVFHMDNFFLRPFQRTPERLNEPGGNVDSERFLEEVILPVRSGASQVTFRPYNCRKKELMPPIEIKVKPLVVVEGAYSCHPLLNRYYDLKIFLTLDKAEQTRRLTLRNGPELLKRFKKEWIPLEERYFSVLRIPDICDLRFYT